MYLKVFIKYSTNITPQNYLTKQNLTIKNKIFLKNFFIILLIFDYLSNKDKLLKIKVVYLPIKNKTISFLRAPNRSKSSQITLKTQKYKIIVMFFLKKIKPLIKLNKPHFIVFLLKKKYFKFKFFESSNLLIENLKIYFNYNYNLK